MNVVSISTNAFLADMFCKHSQDLPDSILNHIAKVVDYDLISDWTMVDSKVINFIKWNRVDKMKLIRILIRCLDQDIDILDKLLPQLHSFEYKIKELVHLLCRRPRYIEYFSIDLNNLTTSEAAILLSFGDNFFLEKIDLKKYKFNSKESMDIIQAYNYDRAIIEQVNYKSLNGHQISEILSKNGDRDIDILDISKLTNIDWINLLESRPEMIGLCDYSKFINSDIFYSIKLCCMYDVPDLSKLIIERDMDSISPFGWEKLLIEKPETFLAHCNFSKLDENNWKQILASHPDLKNYKVNQ